jgi:hypothetical protein
MLPHLVLLDLSPLDLVFDQLPDVDWVIGLGLKTSLLQQKAAKSRALRSPSDLCALSTLLVAVNSAKSV